MPIINEEDTKFIRGYIAWFENQIRRRLREAISSQVGDSMPPDVREVERQVQQLADRFTTNSPFTVDLPISLIPIFKRMMIEVRRQRIPEIELHREATHHPFLLQTLDEKQRPIDELMGQEWLRAAVPTKIPFISEYIPLKRIIEMGPPAIPMRQREYDQKFRILQAPGLIIDDLTYYRDRCSQRGTPVTVAFMDIDDFKQTFNANYGEIEVDRRVLPVLMSRIEAHAFDHGFAYRHGGDEFVLVIPNMSFEVVTVFLDMLRRSIETLDYHGIESRATVSTGFVHVDNDCFLTDREIVKRANDAKKFCQGEWQEPNCYVPRNSI